MKKVATEIG